MLLRVLAHDWHSKKVFTALLDAIAFGPEDLDNHKADLRAIANQCPLDGGDAVYQARSLLLARDANYVYDDLANCASAPASKEAVDLREAPEVLLYPNPVSSELRYTTTDGTQPTRVEVFSALGRLMLNGDTDGRLDVTGLTTGIYSVRFEFADGATSTHLVSVQ